MIYMTFLGGVFGPFLQEKEQEAGPKHPLKKSYRSYFRRAQIRRVIWPSSTNTQLTKFEPPFGSHRRHTLGLTLLNYKGNAAGRQGSCWSVALKAGRRLGSHSGTPALKTEKFLVKKSVALVKRKHGFTKTPWTENPGKNKEKSALVNPSSRLLKRPIFFY